MNTYMKDLMNKNLVERIYDSDDNKYNVTIVRMPINGRHCSIMLERGMCKREAIMEIMKEIDLIANNFNIKDIKINQVDSDVRFFIIIEGSD